MTSTLAGSLICRSTNCIQSILLRESLTVSRVLTCQPHRYRRRTPRTPQWFVRQEAQKGNENLTEENKEFIKELVKDEYSNIQHRSPLKDEPWPRGEWTFNTRRTGLLALKLGTVKQWTKDGQKITASLLQVVDNHVIRYTPPDKFVQSSGWNPWWRNRYGSVVVGALSCDPHQFTKSYNNLFSEAGVPPKRKLTRFLVTPNAKIQPGTPLSEMHFRVGDYVDCSAKTRDHGFQGVRKRWGFKGGRASHGTTKTHNKMGSSGGGRKKGGVRKGKKMPGHMGGDWRTMKGLRVLRINTKYNVMYVRGHTPGPNYSFVRVYDTVLPNRRKELMKDSPPLPTFYQEDASEKIPLEIFDENLHQFNDPSINYSSGNKQ